MKTRGKYGGVRGAGFSLIELLVVIAIIGVLATAVTLSVMSKPDEAKVVVVQNDFKTLNTALGMFRQDHSRWPDGFEEMVQGPEHPRTHVETTYIEDLPMDPWTGEPYIWEIDERGKPYFISYGADKTEGGTEFDTDIISNQRRSNER